MNEWSTEWLTAWRARLKIGAMLRPRRRFLLFSRFGLRFCSEEAEEFAHLLWSDNDRLDSTRTERWPSRPWRVESVRSETFGSHLERVRGSICYGKWFAVSSLCLKLGPNPISPIERGWSENIRVARWQHCGDGWLEGMLNRWHFPRSCRSPSPYLAQLEISIETDESG